VLLSNLNLKSLEQYGRRSKCPKNTEQYTRELIGRKRKKCQQKT